MLLHLVLFQFKAEQKEKLEEAKAKILGMMGRIDVLRDLKAGVDVLHSGRSYDLALAATFDDVKALGVYDVHPVHKPVKEFLGPLLEKSVSVDFEY